MIAAAQGNPSLHAAVLLAIFYGLRRASICDLQVGDVDLAAGTIGWVTKTGQRLVRPLHTRVREALAVLAAGRRPNDSLLSYTDYHSLTTAFRRLVKRVGLGRRFRFHGLRHGLRNAHPPQDGEPPGGSGSTRPLAHHADRAVHARTGGGGERGDP